MNSRIIQHSATVASPDYNRAHPVTYSLETRTMHGGEELSWERDTLRNEGGTALAMSTCSKVENSLLYSVLYK